MRCKFCESNDLVRARVKNNSQLIVVCRECDCVYELDENSNPIMNYPPEYIPRFKKLQKIFRSWDELVDIVPCN